MSQGGTTTNVNQGFGSVQPQTSPTVALPTAPMAAPYTLGGSSNPSIFGQSADNQTLAGNTYAATAGPDYYAQSMNQFINPYQQQVLDNAIGRQVTDRNNALNQVGASADAAGAFGGARQGLVESQIYGRSNRNIGELAAKTAQQGFNTAAGLAGNAIASQQNGAAGLANVAGQGFGMGQAIVGQQTAQGTQQQNLLQGILNGANKQFDQYATSPMQAVNTQLAALSANPLNAEVNKSYKPGLLDMLGLGGQLGGQFAQGKG